MNELIRQAATDYDMTIEEVETIAKHYPDEFYSRLEDFICSRKTRGQSEEPPTIDDLAHELWAAAQLLPSEGVVDGANRITGVLEEHGVKL